MRGQVVKAPPSAAVAVEDEVQITELEKISPTRYDGVKTPANGFPILMMKAVAAAPQTEPPAAKEKPAHERRLGALSKSKRAKALELVKSVLDGTFPIPILAKDAAGYDESADIAGALDVISKISALVCSEATSLGQGRLEEIWDIGTLMDALCAMKCFLVSERSQDDGSGQGDAGLNGSAGLDGAVSYKAAEDDAAKADMSTSAINDLPDEAFAYIEPGGGKDDSGKTTPRKLRHFPVHDKAHAKNALSRAPQSPFGDKAMPKIKAAAKKFGVGGKKTSKGAMLPGSGKNTSSKAAKRTTSTTDVIKKAVAEAAAASEERIKTLEAQLAKVLATPIPGGPLLVTPLTQRPAANPALAKAERLRAIAAQTSDPQVATAYRELAAREERGALIAKD